MEKGLIVKEKDPIRIIKEAVWLRNYLKDGSFNIDVVKHFIDFPDITNSVLSDISVCLVDESEIDPSVEAVSYPDKNLIYLRNSYYEKLVDFIDKGKRTGIALRAKFTLSHEVYHVLAHKNTGMQRANDLTPQNKCSEIQANIFAGSFLIPPFLYPLLKKEKKECIPYICGVSRGCAYYQMKLYAQLENTLGGEDKVASLHL